MRFGRHEKHEAPATTQDQWGRYGRHPSLALSITSAYSYGRHSHTVFPLCELPPKRGTSIREPSAPAWQGLQAPAALASHGASLPWRQRSGSVCGGWLLVPLRTYHRVRVSQWLLGGIVPKREKEQ